MKKITLCFLLFVVAALQAQPVSEYEFSQSTEAYVAVTGINSTAVGDDWTENNIPIGFPFYFGGQTYETFSISTNGFIRLGTAVGGGNWINALGNPAAQAPLIAPFWDDNNRNSGSIQYLLSGVSPNQTLEVGWDQVNIGNNGQPNNAVSASFKIRLHQNGMIEFIYGSQLDWSGGITTSIGINDLTSFLSVTPAATATASSTSANNLILSTTDIVNVKYVFTPDVSCTGIPEPGNTLSSAASVCAGYSFTLSVENDISAAGISYQWQSSSDGVSFTDIPDATTPEITLTQTAETTYRVVVTCLFGAAAESTPVTVEMSTANCYCIPTYTFGKTDGDLISNIVITGTTLSNNTGTVPQNPAFTYFTGQPNYTAALEAGSTYEIQVTVGSFGQQNSAVWIDFNDDDTFSQDERIGYTTSPTGSFGTASYTIELGCDAPAGLHRMRVRDVWNTAGSAIDPCANYGYGETEDYDVTILAQTTCPVATNLHASEVGAYSAMLEWDAGCGQTSWNVFLTLAGGIPQAPTYSNVTSPFIASDLSASTDYEFYVMAQCDGIGESVWAGPFGFTTAPVPVDNDECDAAFSLTVGDAFDQYALVTTNAGATKSLGQPDPDCAAFNFGGDVWYSAIVPATGNVTFETRSQAGSPILDTGLSVYSGSCALLASLGCSDDEGDGAFSRLTVTGLTPGETLYARVWEYANDAIGEFRISAFDSTLANDTITQTGFSFYPNPVKDNLHISSNSAISQVEIVNLLGQKVLTQEFDTASAQIDFSKFPKGAYLVKLSSSGQINILKVIKE